MMLKAPFDLDTVQPTCPVCRHTVPYLTAMHCCPECEDADLIAQQAEAIESERRANELSQCPMCGKQSDQDNDLCADCSGIVASREKDDELNNHYRAVVRMGDRVIHRFQSNYHDIITAKLDAAKDATTFNGAYPLPDCYRVSFTIENRKGAA